MRTIIHLLGVVLFGTVLGSAAALAQSAGLDEAIQPNGTVVQNLELTAAQKSAIYHAVFQQRMRPYTVLLTAAVGAPVPQSVELTDLPDAATAGDPYAANLKYAMVDTNNIVVVDPVLMRVVDVIHDSIKP
jgi:Protein of unknown function (DUF1236)